MRLTITWIFLIFLAAVFSGCSKPKNDPEVVVLKMTLWDKQKDLEFYDKALPEFYKDHPNIRVKIESVPWTRMFDKLLISTAGGRCPDVSRISSTWFTPCAAKGLLECLEPYMAKDPEFDIKDFYQPAVKGWGTYKGKVYALPGDVDIYCMYYNKTMFDRYGVPYPDETWDWARHLRAAKRLTRDRDGDGRLDQWGANPDQWQTYVWQNGGDILSKDLTRCTLDQPAAYKAIQSMADLRTKYKVAPSAADMADIGAQKLFTNGQIGMFVSGSWAAALIFKDEIKDFDWDVAPLPKGKTRASFIGGAAFGILRGSKHKKEAWELVKFMTSPSMQRHFAQEKHIIPSRRSVAESGAYLYLSGKPRNKKAFIDSISYGHPLPNVECSREMNEIISSEIVLATLGRKRAEDACKKVTPLVNDLLKYQVE